MEQLQRQLHQNNFKKEMEIIIKKLDPQLIATANNISMFGKRGDLSAAGYKDHCKIVLEWPISDKKSKKLLIKFMRNNHKF